jgi:predicted nucleic acid-binding protein
MPHRLLLLDNTVLTNFALVGRPHLALALWLSNACATTRDVIAEYELGVATRGLTADAWHDLLVLPMQPDEAAFADPLSSRLGRGERSCIAMAVSHQALFATDDADARRVAQSYGLPLTGTVGLLALAVQQGLLTLADGNRLLNDMVTCGYRSPLSRLDEFL